jgi:hypothetical protein
MKDIGSSSDSTCKVYFQVLVDCFVKKPHQVSQTCYEKPSIAEGSLCRCKLQFIYATHLQSTNVHLHAD